MTSHDLRDLLRDRVADETAVDLAAGAWSAGRSARRRRALGLVGAGALGIVLVGGSLALLTSLPPASGPTGSPAPDQPTGEAPSGPSPGLTAVPDATYQGVPVTFGPDQAEERRLPYIEDGPLGETIDLDVRTKALAGPPRAAFGLGRRVVLVDGLGGVVSVDVSRLEPLFDEGGNRFSPVTSQMLSPDGRHLMFPQEGSVAVYDIARGRWTSLDTQGRPAIGATWVADDTVGIPLVDRADALRVFNDPGVDLFELDTAVLTPSFDVGPATPYGATVTGGPSGESSAQAWGMGVDLPVDDPATDLPEPEFLAVDTGRDAVLSITWDADVDDPRSKQCCPVAGWLDGDTVVYESRQAEPTLVAWTVGTDEFRRVTTIEDPFTVASYADLG